MDWKKIYEISFEASVFVAKSLVDGDQNRSNNLQSVWSKDATPPFWDIIAKWNWLKGDETALAARWDK